MLRVNPEQLIQAGHQFRQASAETEAMMAGLDSSVNGLMAEWHGAAADMFYQEYQEWQRMMRSMGHSLETIGEQLVGYAQNIAQLDQGF